MFRYNCIVRLGGDMRREVVKKGVSAAEIVVLRHIHGHDAIHNVQPMDPEKKFKRRINGKEVMLNAQEVMERNEFTPLPRGYHDEYVRLESIYGAKRLDSIFPGYQKILPAKYEDIAPISTQPSGFTVVSSNNAEKAAPGIVVEGAGADDGSGPDPAFQKVTGGAATMYTPPGDEEEEAA